MNNQHGNQQEKDRKAQEEKKRQEQQRQQQAQKPGQQPNAAPDPHKTPRADSRADRGARSSHRSGLERRSRGGAALLLPTAVRDATDRAVPNSYRLRAEPRACSRRKCGFRRRLQQRGRLSSHASAQRFSFRRSAGVVPAVDAGRVSCLGVCVGFAVGSPRMAIGNGEPCRRRGARLFAARVADRAARRLPRGQRCAEPRGQLSRPADRDGARQSGPARHRYLPTVTLGADQDRYIPWGADGGHSDR